MMTMDALVGPSSTDVARVDQPLQAVTLEILRMEPGQAHFGPDTNLFELGLESLTVVELLTRIEMQFDIVIDVEDLSAELFQHYGRLRDFVARKVAGMD